MLGYVFKWGFSGGSVVKNLPAVQETWVLSLGWEDPLQKEIVVHFSILVWERMNRGTWQAKVHEVIKESNRT